MLRDLCLYISDNVKKNVGVVDERGEISAMYQGIAQNNIGIRTDCLDNVPKHIGMRMLIRSMNPEVLITDEIGSKSDIDAINYAVCSGVKVVFTAHGRNFKDLTLNPVMKELIEKKLFERIIFLTRTNMPGQIKEVFGLDEDKKEYIEMGVGKYFVVNM